MNKLLNGLKSFLGIVVFFGIQILFILLFRPFIYSGNDNIINIIYILIELITLLVLVFIYLKKIKDDFIDFDNNYKEYLKGAFKIYLFGIMGMIISNLIINNYIVDGIAYNEQVDRLLLFKYPLYSVLAIIITGPFIEEVAFRLGFKEYINNKYIYFILATLIFAFVHVINGLNNPIELVYIIPYGSLSFAFTYMLYKYDNIFVSTIIHTLHNTISILLIVSISLLGV